jgi:hypothetical protein
LLTPLRDLAIKRVIQIGGIAVVVEAGHQEGAEQAGMRRSGEGQYLDRDSRVAGRLDQVPELSSHDPRVPDEVAALAAAHPEHEIWAEQPPGLDRLKYVAQRRKGTSAQPYLVMTDDLAELRDALRAGPPIAS